ncbi:T9SS type A sorting domain-containing protein [Psychroserpens sp.]|uniref:T9SS type A sorting domain-containing protein n=1 Tax=Psychroserpens sp. TaxID=2020870 RepID=UPI001AFE468D|nr:T9SS type A sorting domain-containing protein [Psychroserpens sp.]MBO6606286.1 T9SS type A sorting domain-containing protein [Psychroserpens sp.]MBO6652990.1 T9SS type A sorting domain-containing protein [Psychroserpens sp.]MBO6680983.1 T9SS type A sorting domain-containing protein [Psychroserpens sp.]MBO6750061.1 T9SS type A sorting domain-containing protein [Psychroserpens sp.]MBO6914541.1 T9SS type A sorting domain-containing protein [Psychroserpens sp.]
MKYFYTLILCILCSAQLAAQSDLLGQWYLDYIEVDNVIHNNYYNEQHDMGINFTNTQSSPTDLMFSGLSSCNAYGGDYNATSSTITINTMFVTTVDCGASPRGAYELSYMGVLQNNFPVSPFNLTYTVTGTGMDQVLTLTNPSGDSAVFGKTPSTILLVQTWYLSRIEIPGNPNIDVPVSDTPTMTLTNNIDSVIFQPEAIGFGDCNGFEFDYDIGFNTDGDVIQVLNFAETLAFCPSNYEFIYFDILGNPASNYFVFEIVNNGQTLLMTDLLGVTLVFGDSALSVESVTNNDLLALKENPITTSIDFMGYSETISDSSYSIISVSGQTIKTGSLTSERIDTSWLDTGVYILRIQLENEKSQVFKIIKE